MNDITFTKQNGGLARPLAGEDHYSGLLFYSTLKPSGWSSDSVRQVTSIEHAVSLGIAAGDANFGVMYYHIKEFFRLNPGATLFVGIFTAPVTMDFAEIKTVQREAAGKIRQIGVFLTTTFKTGDIRLIQSVCDTLDTEHMPLSVLYASDFEAYVGGASAEDLTDMPDLRELDAEKVTVIFGQDGAADGADLFESTGKSVTCLGAALGAVSKAKVHENIGWVEKFPMSVVELDTPAFADGTLYKDTDPNLIDSLNSKGYVFLVKHVGISGTYFNDAHTCILITSDYAYLENNRTIDKAIRGVRTYLLPQLNSPLKVDAESGKLDPNTIAFFEAKANEPLTQMERDGELSGYLATINPDQNVLSTSILEIVIANVPLGVARKINVKIGFTTSV